MRTIPYRGDDLAKSNVKSKLMAGASVVNVLAQAVFMDDLHRAITARAMTSDDAHAELGKVIPGERPGLWSADEITVDSTGTGVQNVAAAARAYEFTCDRGIGLGCDLGMIWRKSWARHRTPLQRAS